MRSNTDYNGKLVRNMLHNAKRETHISHLFQIDALRNLGEKKKDYITSDQQCRHIYTYIFVLGVFPVNITLIIIFPIVARYTVEFSISGLPN